MPRIYKVLVIEDNAADFTLIKRKLLRGIKGFGDLEITHSLSREEAENWLQVNEPDCVFVDYLLGAENGIDVLSSLLKAFPLLPFVMLTGQGDEKVAVEAMKIGAYDYLVKDETSEEGIALCLVNTMKRAELQRKYKDKQRELEDFAYTAAHDIKSPLVSINQTAQMVEWQADDLGNKNLKELSAVLVERSKYITDFVTQLLEYAKTGRSERVNEVVDFGEIVKLVRVNLEALITKAGAKIEADNSYPTFSGDKLALTQLVQNLVSNGIKFAKPGVPPEIKIRAVPIEVSVVERHPEEKIKICVEDNGVGIPKKDCDRVLSPLVRLSRDADIEGSGLGLAIAKKIADQHDGELWIDSEEGQGTTVSLVFKA